MIKYHIKYAMVIFKPIVSLLNNRLTWLNINIDPTLKNL